MERTDSQEMREHSLHAVLPPQELVCVYAYEDEQFYRELQRYLHLWVRQHQVCWLEISAGEAIEETMENHLRRATGILLLLSPDFLAKDSTYEAMLTAIAEGSRRQVPVVPVLARTSLWKESECRTLNALPEHERPIVAWERREDAYENIRQGLLHVLPALQAHARLLELELSAASRATDFQVRDLPGEYVARTAILAEIKHSILDSNTSQTTAITTALRGAGGFGKTTLAMALCHDPDIQAAFPDGVLWIELGEQPPRLLDLLNNLLARLAGPEQVALTLEEAREHWRATLASKACLLVIDDVWQKSALTALLEGGPRCQRLVTTRNDRVLPPEVTRVVVDAMEPAEALAVLCQGLLANIQQPAVQAALTTLAKQLGYWPLLLSMARGLLTTQLRYGRPLMQALAGVEQVYHAQKGVSWQQSQASGFHEAIDASMQSSLRQLQAVVPSRYDVLERYQELAIFPEDTDIPIASLRLFWKVTVGLEGWEVDNLCMQLQSLSLLLTCDLETEIIRLHDVVRTYLIQRAGSCLPLLHTRFLDALSQGLQVKHWAEVPLSDRYLWRYLFWHLCQAERWEEMEVTLADLRYLTEKAWVCGVDELEEDLTLAVATMKTASTSQRAVSPIWRELSFLPALQRRVGNIGHLLRRSTTLADMGGIMLSHLGWEEPFAGQRPLLEQFLPRPYLTAWYPLPEASSPALLRTIDGHTSGVTDCAVSPGGRYIVSASRDNTLKVWDAATGRKRHTLKGHTDGVTSCAVSPDGRYIVSASDDHTLKVWDAATGAERHTLKGHTREVTDCAVSPDSRYIVSASNDYTLKVWDAVTGAERHTLKGHTWRVFGCAVSPDGRYIVSASLKMLKVWDAVTGRKRHTLKGHRAVLGCAVSPNGHFIVSASDDHTLKVWDAATGAERHTLRGHTSGVTDCAVSPDSRYIVSASDDHTLKVWDAVTGAERHTLKGHTSWVTSCAVSPDGHFIVSASDDHTLKVWDAATGAKQLLLGDQTREVTGCAVSPDGRFIVSASNDKTLKVWDAATGAERHTLRGHTNHITGCAVSPDSRYIVSTSRDNTLKVWDAANGAKHRTLKGHTSWVTSCAVSPDGHFIVSASNDHTLKVWDAATGAKRHTLRGHTNYVACCAVSPDSRFIVSASWDNTLKVWDAVTGAERHTLKGHTDYVTCCAVSPDGRFIVSASHDKRLKMWDVATGTERLTLRGHTNWIDGCAVSPDSRFIVSTSNVPLVSDHTLKMWDAQTGRCVLTFRVDGKISDCAFHPDGEHLAACGAQGVYFLRLVQ